MLTQNIQAIPFSFLRANPDRNIFTQIRNHVHYYHPSILPRPLHRLHPRLQSSDPRLRPPWKLHRYTYVPFSLPLFLIHSCSKNSTDAEKNNQSPHSQTRNSHTAGRATKRPSSQMSRLHSLIRLSKRDPYPILSYAPTLFS